ncbi:MAG: transposase [Oscillospiraceae bacterium]|nr:transposase [Oscillospiraceae bacterium]
MNKSDHSDKNIPSKHRKPNRLSGYDYSSPGYYFLTICTEYHQPLFGSICAHEDGTVSSEMVLNDTGQAVAAVILAIPEHYPGIILDKYVVMPNHIHLILAIPSSLKNAPNISRIVLQFKRAVSIRLGKSIWQLGFHDHIIRDEREYQEIWNYIDNNPLKWALDKYYREA